MKPTVARVVHYYTDQPDQAFNGAGRGPYPAIITQVWNTSPDHDTMANLKVFPSMGEPYDVGSVYEKAQAEKHGMPGRYWIWPPRE